MLDALHFERNLAKEDNVRAQLAAAGTARNIVEARIDGMVFNGRTAALPLAAGLRQLAVHVDEMARTGALVQIVHILRAQKKPLADLPLQLRQSQMGGIRLRILCRRAPFLL